jgi:hypothetical protein
MSLHSKRFQGVYHCWVRCGRGVGFCRVLAGFLSGFPGFRSGRFVLESTGCWDRRADFSFLGWRGGVSRVRSGRLGENGAKVNPSLGLSSGSVLFVLLEMAGLSVKFFPEFLRGGTGRDLVVRFIPARI